MRSSKAEKTSSRSSRRSGSPPVKLNRYRIHRLKASGKALENFHRNISLVTAIIVTMPAAEGTLIGDRHRDIVEAFFPFAIIEMIYEAVKGRAGEGGEVGIDNQFAIEFNYFLTL